MLLKASFSVLPVSIPWALTQPCPLENLLRASRSFCICCIGSIALPCKHMKTCCWVFFGLAPSNYLLADAYKRISSLPVCHHPLSTVPRQLNVPCCGC